MSLKEYIIRDKKYFEMYNNNSNFHIFCRTNEYMEISDDNINIIEMVFQLCETNEKLVEQNKKYRMLFGIIDDNIELFK